LWDELLKSYKDYRFTSKYARCMAEKVLEYRMEKEFNAVTENVSLFMNWEGVSPDEKISFGTSLSDCALFNIATAPTNRFSILVYYAPMYNHPRYIDCVKAYNENNGTFNAVAGGESTRNVIIREILTPVKNKTSLATLVLEHTTDAELYQLLRQGYVGSV
jgi:hypothetical protein